MPASLWMLVATPTMIGSAPEAVVWDHVQVTGPVQGVGNKHPCPADDGPTASTATVRTIVGAYWTITVQVPLDATDRDDVLQVPPVIE